MYWACLSPLTCIKNRFQTVRRQDIWRTGSVLYTLADCLWLCLASPLRVLGITLQTPISKHSSVTQKTTRRCKKISEHPNVIKHTSLNCSFISCIVLLELITKSLYFLSSEDENHYKRNGVEREQTGRQLLDSSTQLIFGSHVFTMPNRYTGC